MDQSCENKKKKHEVRKKIKQVTAKYKRARMEAEKGEALLISAIRAKGGRKEEKHRNGKKAMKKKQKRIKNTKEKKQLTREGGHCSSSIAKLRSNSPVRNFAPSNKVFPALSLRV